VHIPSIEWHRTDSLDEALTLAGGFRPHVRFLAGGTDLLPDLKTGRVSTRHVVSLNHIPELRGITTDKQGLRIPALTTPNQLAASTVVRRHFVPLLDAACEMAAPQVRSMATIGGNIASAIPSADLPPILLVMHAWVTLVSANGQRDVPLESFFRGPRQSVRGDAEILTAIRVPHGQPGSGAAYIRFALRAANACAVAGVAASVRVDGQHRITAARIALGAVAPTPCLVPAAGDVLIGQSADEAAFEDASEAACDTSNPISDIRASAEFRRHLVGVLTRRALSTALRRAKESWA